MEILFDSIFMFKEGRGLCILCEMNKTSKGGQKVGYDIQMAYYLTLTARIQVLSTCKMI